jgi:chromosome partitioning protein
VIDDFDYILIDCPPSLGLITVNGLAAADEVLVPIQCEYYALEGLGQLMRNVHLVQANLNDKLDISTIVLTMYDARTKLAEQVATRSEPLRQQGVPERVIPGRCGSPRPRRSGSRSRCSIRRRVGPSPTGS